MLAKKTKQALWMGECETHEHMCERNKKKICDGSLSLRSKSIVSF